MHDVIIDLKTMKVIGYDIIPKPLEFSINIDSLDSIRKTITTTVEKQKINFMGEKLYKVISYGKEFQATESEIKKYKNVTPITETTTKTEMIKFLNNMSEFNLDDILLNKKEQIIQSVGFENCLLFEINLQDNIDLEYSEHKADTGLKIIRILPKGQVKLKPISLGNKVQHAKIELESSNDVNIKFSFDGQEYYDHDKNVLISNLEGFDTLHLILTNDGEDNSIDIESYHILF